MGLGSQTHTSTILAQPWIARHSRGAVCSGKPIGHDLVYGSRSPFGRRCGKRVIHAGHQSQKQKERHHRLSSLSSERWHLIVDKYVQGKTLLLEPRSEAYSDQAFSTSPLRRTLRRSEFTTIRGGEAESDSLLLTAFHREA